MNLMLGLPDLRGALVDRARQMQLPVLVTVNRLAVRRRDEFLAFRTDRLAALDGLDAHLDSAGFVAMVRYRGFDWSVGQYVAVGAAYPWRWFASMDACVERELAPNREVVRDRIAWTVALNRACRIEAQAQGCAHRLMPVIQGARADDYLRCLDQMAWAADGALLGVGSMCRRHTQGLDGVVAAVDRIDRTLGSAPARLHLFGVKSDAAEALRGHPRVASADSQAYGIEARQKALRLGVATGGQGNLLGHPRFSKTAAYTAEVMAGWARRQQRRLARPGAQPVVTDDLLRHALPPPAQATPWDRKMDRARRQLQELLAAGEIEWEQLTEQAVAQVAADLDDEDNDDECNGE